MNHIPEIENVRHRSMDRIVVGFEEKLFDLFLLKIGNVELIGRKTPARLHPNKDKQKCCLVEPEMLLGLLCSFRVDQRGVSIYYRSTTDEEATELFRKVREDRKVTLSYPFARLSKPNFLERAPQPEEWTPDTEFAEKLDSEEFLLRSSTIKLIAPYSNDIKVAYDPACSTGTFLKTLKAAYPHIRTIGQDRNSGMVDIARLKVDEVFVGDSVSPGPRPSSVDLVVFRYLNVEVLSSPSAEELFRTGVSTLRSGGYAIVFGHTPVLCPVEWFEMEGFSILNRIGCTEDSNGIFELYLLQRGAMLKSLKTPKVVK